MSRASCRLISSARTTTRTMRFGSEDDETEMQLAKSRARASCANRRRTRGGARAGGPSTTRSGTPRRIPRDPLHDEPYAAAFVVKTVMEANGLVEGYSFWTFSDIFEENYFPSVPFHGGFGLLTLSRHSEADLSGFELLHRLGDELFLVDGLHETVDAWVVRDGHR